MPAMIAAPRRFVSVPIAIELLDDSNPANPKPLVLRVGETVLLQHTRNCRQLSDSNGVISNHSSGHGSRRTSDNIVAKSASDISRLIDQQLASPTVRIRWERSRFAESQYSPLHQRQPCDELAILFNCQGDEFCLWCELFQPIGD